MGNIGILAASALLAFLGFGSFQKWIPDWLKDVEVPRWARQIVPEKWISQDAPQDNQESEDVSPSPEVSPTGDAEFDEDLKDLQNELSDIERQGGELDTIDSQ